MTFGTQQTQHLLALWFKHQQFLLPCYCSWVGTDWRIQLKIHISMNLQFKTVMKKSLHH